MRYLLDTHALLWFSERSDKLSQRVVELIKDPKNIIYVSAASLWR
jgi:PIN domain nuclease of toxin-antitoxin system